MNADTLFAATKSLTHAEGELASALPGGTDEQIKRAVDHVSRKRCELASALHVLDHLLGHLRSPEKQCLCTPEEIRAAHSDDGAR